ncbi:hypothetical protein HYH03_017418 [Edaphochlamys debaryana]|nr:hypothetical protein HYH03_017418 [Edaphochlamys debaryana]|eukprot:KAG2483764.1 hypothetical protein HYH03_017418 [Edaphochlamys debaryana]
MQPPSPSPPPAPPTPPPRPPFPSPSPPPPRPPPTYPPPPSPPVPHNLPIRIADGRSNTSGILQIWDEATQAWGSVCISPSAFESVAGPSSNDEYWTELAVLACRQMGLPSARAAIVNPESRRYPWRTHKLAEALPAKAVIRLFYSGCAEAATAKSMFDCVGQLAVLDRAVEDCDEAAQLVGVGETFTPIAITCRNPRKASPPPPSPPPVPPMPPSPPPPPPLQYGNYTMRRASTRTTRATTRTCESEAHKAKISAAKKGKPKTEAHKAKISAAKKGKKRKPFTAEHKAKISAAQTGKPLSEAHKANISAGQKRKREAE